MRKILILILSTVVAACTPHDADTIYVPVSQAQEQTPVVTQTEHKSRLVTNGTPRTFNPKKTYMADLAKQLKKTAGNSGISVKQQDAKIVVSMPDDVLFGSNQNSLDRQAETIIAEMAKTLNTYDSTKIQIFGYTDNVGIISENRELSLRHANLLANFLRLNNVDINRIIVDGLGPKDPIANNETEANRRRNRRVEMTLINMQ